MNHSEAGKLGYLKSKDKLHLHKRIRREKYSENPNKCNVCGKALEWKKRNNKHCSQKCSGLSKRKDILYGKYSKKQCIQCGCDIFKPRNYNNKFCSVKCQQIFNFKRRREMGENIKRAPVRKYLLNTREHKCHICNNTVWNNEEIPLETHHIDGNSSNNDDDNITLICPNCHALTDTYKHKNRGNGREYRRVKK